MHTQTVEISLPWCSLIHLPKAEIKGAVSSFVCQQIEMSICELLLNLLQLLEELGVYQVIPFMTHLELNHIKDDKVDSEKAHKGQEAVKLIHAGLQPEYKGRFKLQVRRHTQ